MKYKHKSAVPFLAACRPPPGRIFGEDDADIIRPERSYFQTGNAAPLIRDPIDSDVMPAPSHIGDDGELDEDDKDEKDPAIPSVERKGKMESLQRR